VGPARYQRFQQQRSQPFHDLVAMLPALDAPRVVDLGCGTGELTAHLHRALGARETLGVDTSERMLEQAAAHTGGGLSFRRARLEELADEAGFDLVFSNAALQWVDDHPALLHELGLRPPEVRLVVYPHELESRADVVRWVAGTLLTAYERRLPAELFAAFAAEFEARVTPRLAGTRPHLYPFKRILFTGALAPRK
jgi:trans-aconitate methyltransferase